MFLVLLEGLTVIDCVAAIVALRFSVAFGWLICFDYFVSLLCRVIVLFALLVGFVPVQDCFCVVISVALFWFASAVVVICWFGCLRFYVVW